MVCPLQMERLDCSLVDLDKPFIDAAPESRSNNTCSACGFHINDQWIYKVMDDNYHEQCLRCSCCQMLLSSSTKCFTRYGSIYCEHHHQLLYGKRCRRCMSFLQPSDVVHRVSFLYYHTHCFSCFSCHNTFNLGDEYHVLENEVYCKNEHKLIRSFGSDALIEESFKIDNHRKTPKRPRTILNAQQRRQFKNAFERSSKPSRKIREQLANETGLSVRVVQVWFQNQRAKIKKTGKKDNSMDTMKSEMNNEDRSTEEIKSSDDEEFVLNIDSDEIDSRDTYADPIQKLFNMTSSETYFPFHS